MTKDLDKKLDQLLQSNPRPKAPHHLRQSILEAAPQKKRFDLTWLWPFGPLWQPTSIMACALAVGLYMGILLNAQLSNDLTIYDIESQVMGEYE
jgi:hypothetical protein